MKALFVTPSDTRWASTRLRAVWPARYVNGAETCPYGEHVNIDADTYIFVKLFDEEFAKKARAEGKRVYWDMCDPAWWWNPREARMAADIADGIVISNEGLANDFADWYGTDEKVHIIPDRIEMEYYPKQRKHEHANPVRFIWFGAFQNRISLFGALAYLERLTANGHNIALTIFDDQPNNQWGITDNFPIYHVLWNLEQENQIISSHDIAILPPYPGAWGRVKSNNKNLTAWACGLPVCDGQDYEYMDDLCSNEVLRRQMAAQGRLKLEASYQAQLSGMEWEAILCQP